MSNAILDITDDMFQEHVLENSKNKIVLVDFWAPWCMPCRMQTEILEAVQKEIASNALLTRMNVDENTKIPIEYKVASIPTLVLFKNAKVIETLVGVQQKEVLINKLLEVK